MFDPLDGNGTMVSLCLTMFKVPVTLIAVCRSERFLAFTAWSVHLIRMPILTVQVGDKHDVSQVLRPGREMVAAGYCLYGSSTILVLSTSNSVNGYTLDSVSSFIANRDTFIITLMCFM